MKRSHKVYLTILPAIALMACDTPPVQPDDVKHCVDEDGGVVEDSNCDVDASQTSTDGTESTPHHTGFRWYYGGTRTVWMPGTRVSGGSFTPSAGKTYGSPTTISRGGFGTIGRGVGVGAGE